MVYMTSDLNRSGNLFVVEVAGAALRSEYFFTDSHVLAADYNEPEAARGLAPQHRTPIGSSVVLASP